MILNPVADSKELVRGREVYTVFQNTSRGIAVAYVWDEKSDHLRVAVCDEDGVMASWLSVVSYPSAETASIAAEAAIRSKKEIA